MPPHNWRERKIGELVASGILDVSDGYRMKNEELGSFGIPFVRGGDIGDGWINTNTIDHIRPEFVARLQTKLTQPGDAAFITKGTVGRAGYLREGQPQVVFAPQVAYWRSLDSTKLVPRFLFYLMKSPAFAAALDADKTHGAMVADYVSISQQLNFKFLFPPASEQQVIVSILGALDDKIDLNRRMNETLEAMARAIFKDWFVDFGPTRAKIEGRAPYLAPDIWALFPDRLDDEGKPAGWSELPLDQIADFLNGIALQKYPSLGADFLPVIKIAQLRANNVDGADRASTDVAPAYVIENGDVLFSWSGSLLHRVWTGGRGALNQHLFKVTSSKCPKWFFFHWIGHHMTDFQSTAASKATTMGHIQRYHLTQAVTVVGDDPLMRAADAIIGPLFDRAIANDFENRSLAKTRDLLLPKLMSGEIRVKATEKIAEAAQ
ncbi:restriction endonuclease subunit S [uncultured Rhodoblastus sp.]|uniref:restriction endonuclease subunit S n=1 Tax=uncultured Rhodoblastus sp. TaxID=543037 RepID=UPI0025F9A63C|nr:restriction endonuclease subunit S [uncultured Rhodoblastus sp.]